MNESAASTAERLLESAVECHIFPGAVAEAGSSRDILWRASFGTLSFDDDASAAGGDTLYDLASLTKPIATTSVALKLETEQRLALDTPVSSIIPEWSGADQVGTELLLVAMIWKPDCTAARLLSAAGITQHTQRIAVIVEGQFLRIAQADVNDFHVAAIGIATQNCAAIGEVKLLSFLVLHVQATIADAEIELAIGAHAQTVQVVANEGNVNAEASGQ